MNFDTEQIKAAIRDKLGSCPGEIIPDGRIRRFQVGERRNQNGWYVFYSGGFPVCIFGDWRNGGRHKWTPRGEAQLSDEELAELRRKADEARRERDSQRQAEQAAAAKRAAKIWDAAQPAAPDHPYLKRKAVKPHGIRQQGKTLLVPVKNKDGELISLQRIVPDGQKLFLKGGKTAGGAFTVHGAKDKPLFLCEGYATGATVHELTGARVVIAFNARNLEPVARAIRELQPDREVIIAADNDAWTDGNPGVTAATAAAKAIGARVAIPKFKDASSKPTDWNDLAALEGGQAVIEQLEAAGRTVSAIRQKGLTAADLMRTEFAEPRWAVPGILPEGVVIIGGKPKHGKSILALNISLSIAGDGGLALGSVAVDKGTVLYLALEDTFRRLKKRIEQMAPLRPDGQGGYHTTAPEGLHLFTEWPRLGDGAIKELSAFMVDYPETRLIIVDTLAKIRPASAAKSNVTAYEKDYEPVSRLKAEVADRCGVSVLIVHHLRKMGATDIMDTFSGTLGLTGAADSLLVLERQTGQADAVLHVTGRDVEAETYALKFDARYFTWNLLGKSDDVKSTEERQKLYDALKEADEPLSPKEIAEITELRKNYVRKTLLELVKDGSVKKVGYGKYTHTLYGNSGYTGNSRNTGNTGNTPANGGKSVQSVPGGQKDREHFKANKDKDLSASVPSVPSVPTHCQVCRAYDKSTGLCHGAAFYKGKSGRGVPADQVKECPNPETKNL